MRSRAVLSYDALRSQALSIRSSMNGIHPTWPSLKAMRSVGNLARRPDESQSTRAAMAFWAVSATQTRIGASADVVVSFDDDPMCMLTTVSVSWQAAHSGSQCPEWMLGNPRVAGFSETAMACDPLSAQRR